MTSVLRRSRDGTAIGRRTTRRRILAGLELFTGAAGLAGGLLLVAAPDAGAGLIAFEAFELAWIGFQPLEVVFAVVGAVVLTLAAGDR